MTVLGERDPILVIDTATRAPTLAVARGDGQLVDERQWPSEHRHGEQLLERLEDLLRATTTEKHELRGVVVGVGPGSFTGLRIGLATAKTIAYSLDVPVVGVSTTKALALAATSAEDEEGELVVVLPAGAADRYVHRFAARDGAVQEVAPPQLAVPGPPFESATAGAVGVAVDLAGAADVPDDWVERGVVALAGLGRAFAVLGTAALRRDEMDEIERLVPAYVALPRGIAQAAAEMQWSPDLR